VSCVGYQRKRVVQGRIQLSSHIIGTFEYNISAGDLIYTANTVFVTNRHLTYSGRYLLGPGTMFERNIQTK
jgi:hypothetical protein